MKNRGLTYNNNLSWCLFTKGFDEFSLQKWFLKDFISPKMPKDFLIEQLDV